jgi:hypothetical protein
MACELPFSDHQTFDARFACVISADIADLPRIYSTLFAFRVVVYEPHTSAPSALSTPTQAFLIILIESTHVQYVLIVDIAIE